MAIENDFTGRFGVMGSFGFLVPEGCSFEINVVGGSVMYGLTRNIALELDVTHTDFNIDIARTDNGSFGTDDISLGAQYRFTDLLLRLTPFLGGGIDILLNDFTDVDGTKLDVDTVVGLHLNGGIDYFIIKDLALTNQMKFVLAPNADIKSTATPL